MAINFSTFDVDRTIVAPVVYSRLPHRVMETGVQLPHDVVDTLSGFLSRYEQFLLWSDPARDPLNPLYFRVDAYIHDDALWILEVNTAFVDGWGVALNLSRASGIKIPADHLDFPLDFATEDDAYLPELQLAVSEISLLRRMERQIVPFKKRGPYARSTYVYGHSGGKNRADIRPYNGIELDDKRHLATFSASWKETRVRIPPMYVNPNTTWENLPANVVLKFNDKSSPAAKTIRESALFGKPAGRAKFWRKSYQEGKVLAQELVEPAKHWGLNSQLVILAIGQTPVAGYVQFSEKRIINDNSIHGPLLFERS